MLHYTALRSFLSYHQGYYCADCLAVRLNLSAEEIRWSMGRRMSSELAIAYQICQSCLHGKGVIALRKSA